MQCGWTPTTVEKLGTVIYNYRHGTSSSDSFLLELSVGDSVHIQEECGGWYRGFVLDNKKKQGIFPASFVKLREHVCVSNAGPYESVVPDPRFHDPIALEVVQVLREWFIIWKRLYVGRQLSLFSSLRRCMLELAAIHRELLGCTTTVERAKELRERIATKIDWGNEKLGLDVVPRHANNCEVVDPESVSVVQLYQIHEKSALNSISVQSSSASNDGNAFVNDKRHVFMLARSLESSLLSSAEIYFTTYDAEKNKNLHEAFVMKYNCKEGSNSGHLACESGASSVLFANLDSDDFHLFKDLYLVARIYRFGKMSAGDAPRKISANSNSVPPVINSSSAAIYRRPYGCGVIGLSNLMMGLSNSVEEQVFRIYSCAESDFWQLPDLIIRKQMNKVNVMTNVGLVASLQLLKGSISEARQQNPSLLKGVALVERSDYLSVITPGDIRNDLLLTLERGEFDKAGKAVGKNVEACVQLIDDDGHVVHDVLLPGDGSFDRSAWHSFIIYHCNAPRWHERFKVHIPLDFSMDKLCKTHLRIILRHCSARDKGERKVFAFAYIPLVEAGGTGVSDAYHALAVFKCEDIAKLSNPTKYFGLPWCVARSTCGMPKSPFSSTTVQYNNEGGMFACSPKDVLYVHTRLCSSKLTQNRDLLMLLKWRSQPDYTRDTLEKLIHLDPAEIFRFLHHVLDTLFELFLTSEGNTTTLSALVFHVLVHVFSLINTAQFGHFMPVFSSYLTSHFAATMAFSGLLRMLRQCIGVVVNNVTSGSVLPAQKACDCLDLLFRVVVQSRGLFVRAFGDLQKEDFEQEVRQTYASFASLMSLPQCGVLYAVQTSLLDNVVQASLRLCDVVSVKCVADVLVQLFQAMDPAYPSSDVVTAKLCAFVRLTKSAFFGDTGAVDVLLPVIVLHLRRHLNDREHLLLCCATLNQILMALYEANKVESVTISKRVELLVVNLLESLVSAILDVRNDITVVRPLVACACTLLRLMQPMHYAALLTCLIAADPEHKKHLKDFLFRLFLLFRDLVASADDPTQCVTLPSGTEDRLRFRYTRDSSMVGGEYSDIYPPQWLTLKLAINFVILLAMQELDDVLREHFLDDCFFDYQLWRTYFNLCVAFAAQPCLQLESCSDARMMILERYPNMIEVMSVLVNVLWSNLGVRKGSFIPALVGPLLEMSLIPQEKVRKVTIPLFCDMIEAEVLARGNFKHMENDFIDKMDILVAEGRGDQAYRQMFEKTTLALLLNKGRAETWHADAERFVKSVSMLLELLLDNRAVMNKDGNRLKCMSCTLNLMNFYRLNMNREEMYCRYVYKLHDLLLESEHHVEAAAALKIHADLLSWERKTLHADLQYPIQFEWQRKESIYAKILSYLDRGKCWEKGIALCKELARFYEEQLFDYRKLSEMLRKEAEFYDKILHDVQRCKAEYFRVGFFGLDYPAFVRNKLFVYRGQPYEKLVSFQAALMSEWPAAVLLGNHVEADQHKGLKGQFLQVCSVKPVPDQRLDGPDSMDIPEVVKHYYRYNDVAVFQCSRPVDKLGLSEPDLELCNMYSQRTTIFTQESLPSVVCWAEVKRQTTELISPVQNACIVVQEKNAELCNLVAKYSAEVVACKQQHTSKPNSQPLLMVLHGVIEAAVNGGVVMYKRAFFDPDFVRAQPQESDALLELRRLIGEQLGLLGKALHVASQLVTAECRPLHDHLCRTFQQMTRDLKDLGSPHVASHRLSAGNMSLPSSEIVVCSPRPVPNRHSGSIVNSPLPLPPVPMRKSSCGVVNSVLCSSNRSSGIYMAPLPQSDNVYASLKDYDRLFSGTSPLLRQSGRPIRSSGGDSCQRTSGYSTSPVARRNGVRPRSDYMESSTDELDDYSNVVCRNSSDSNVDTNGGTPGRIRKLVNSLMVGGRRLDEVPSASQNGSLCTPRLSRSAPSPGPLQKLRGKLPVVVRRKISQPATSHSVVFDDNAQAVPEHNGNGKNRSQSLEMSLAKLQATSRHIELNVPRASVLPESPIYATPSGFHAGH